MDKLVTFRDIAGHLRCGREIEFSYQGRRYSITNANGYWNFCCDTDGAWLERLCPSGELDVLAARAAEASAGGTPVSVIFDQALYDIDTLCIL